MDSVMAIVLPTRVVKNREQADDLFDCPASGGNQQSIAFNATPVRRAVDRIAAALKFACDMIPDSAPL